MGSRLNFISGVEFARLDLDLTDLLLETELTRPVLFTHVISTDPERYDSFSGVVSRPGIQTGVIQMLRGHDRDSESNTIISGHYRYLARVADFTFAQPSTSDIMSDDGDVLQINAVRRSLGDLAYILEVSRVETDS